MHQASVMAPVWAPGASAPVHVAYEAGPCGYPLVRALPQAGVRCTVVAPSLIPQVAGGRRQRIKTDGRDAAQLVRYLRDGSLTAVTVPTEADAALRELTRARQQLQRDVVRARHRVSKLLLRHGQRWAQSKPWTRAYRTWVRDLAWAEPGVAVVCRTYLTALESAEARLADLDAQLLTWPVVQTLTCFRGIGRLSALMLAAEIGDGRRFPTARAFMHYTGLTCREWSSGARRRQGGISKMGNTHLRRVLSEAAWHYRFKPLVGARLRRSQAGQSPAACALAWRAQERLHHKMQTLPRRGKRATVAATAVARELAGFVWAAYRLEGPAAV